MERQNQEYGNNRNRSDNRNIFPAVEQPPARLQKELRVSINLDDAGCDSGCDSKENGCTTDAEETEDVFTFDNVADIIGFATRASPRSPRVSPRSWRSPTSRSPTSRSPTSLDRRERPTTVNLMSSL